ncbi:hypothetical protein EDB87DRAFT_689148 [Lactarius vividus]|nr:hypothetical protein EDB87DRAFT_689148 [Lactarius vividus]
MFEEGWCAEDAVDPVLSACFRVISVVEVKGLPILQCSVKESSTSDRLTASTLLIALLLEHVHTILTQARLDVPRRLRSRGKVNQKPSRPAYFATHARYRECADHTQFENVEPRICDSIEFPVEPFKLYLTVRIWIIRDSDRESVSRFGCAPCPHPLTVSLT